MRTLALLSTRISLIVSCFLLSLDSSSQVIWQEDFEEGVPGSMTEELIIGEANWTENCLGGSSAGVDYPYDGEVSATFHNEYGNDITSALTSPVFDGTGHESLYLIFDCVIRSSNGNVNHLKVEISNDSGITWVTVEDYQNSYVHNWEEQEYELNELIVPTDQMMARFTVVDEDGPCLGLDNIRIEASACPAPTNLQVDTITTTSADISWSNEGQITNWTVQYGEVGFDPNTEIGTFVTANDTDSFTLEGLPSHTELDIYIKADCQYGEESSIWSGPINIVTACGPHVTPFEQDFDEFSYDDLPLCWEDASGGTITTGPENFNGSWWLYDPVSQNHPFHGIYGSGTVHINLYNNFIPNSWLISPEISIPENSNYELRFDLGTYEWGYQHFENFGSDDTLYLLVSDDAGNTWNEIESWGADYSPDYPNNLMTIPLGEFANSTVQFAFLAKDGEVDDPEDLNLYIDNIEIGPPPPCPSPYVTGITPDSTFATFSILPGGGETEWEVRFGPGGFNPELEEGEGFTTTETQGLTVSGLESESNYNIYVRALCDSNSTSEWGSGIGFITESLCQTPTLLNTYLVDHETVRLHWQPNSTHTDFLVRFDAYSTTIVEEADTNVYDIVAPSTSTSGVREFEFDVSTDCGGGDLTEWSNTITMAMPCAPNPYFLSSPQNNLLFTSGSYGPHCWYYGLEGDYATGPDETYRVDDFITIYEGWFPTPFGANFNSNHGLLYPFEESSSSKTWAMSQLIELPDSAHQVSFNVAVLDSANNYSGTIEGGNGVKLMISSDFGYSWEPLWQIDSSYVPVENGELIIEELSEFSGDTIQLALVGITEIGQSESSSSKVRIGRVEIGQAFECPLVTGLETSSLDPTSMNLSWDVTGDGGTYEVVVDYEVIDTTTSTNYLLEDLNPGYSYHISINSLCNDEQIDSYWHDFQTPCGPEVISYFPWVEEFDQTPDEELPCYWFKDDPNEGIYSWHVNSNYLAVYPFGDTVSNYIFTPELDLLADHEYSLEILYEFYSGSNGQLKVFLANDTNFAAIGEEVFNSGIIQDNEWHTVESTFTIDEPGEDHRLVLFVEGLVSTRVYNIKVSSCATPDSLSISNIQSNSADLSWEGSSSVEDWNIQYGELNFDPSENEGTTISSTSNFANLSDLSELTVYDTYVQAVCDSDTTTSFWVGPVTFTTTYQVGSQDLPWADGFDDLNIPDLPDGWSVDDENGDSLTWQSDDQFRMVGATGLYISGSPDQPMDDWIFTPQLQLEEDLSYALSFYYQGGGESIEENLEVLYGGMAEAEGMEIELIDLQGISNTEYQLALVNFSVDADGLYFIGFHGYSDAGSAYIAIDDVRLDVCMANAEFSYDTDTLCTDDGVVIPSIEMVGGTFTAQAGLDINTQTGEIDPSNSEIGSYDVSYFIEEDSLCFDGQTNTIIIDACAGLEEYSESSSVRVYPNPAEDIIRVDLRNIHFTSDVKLELLDVAGKVLKTERVDKPVVVVLEIEDVNTGLYLIRISTGEQVITRRIVVNK